MDSTVPASSSSSNTRSLITSHEYHPHAFLKNRCRECGKAPSEHATPEIQQNANFQPQRQQGVTTTPLGSQQESSIDNSSITDNPTYLQQQQQPTTPSQPNNVYHTTKKCTSFYPHAWKKDRCRDCGGYASQHQGTDIDAPIVPSRDVTRFNVNDQGTPNNNSQLVKNQPTDVDTIQRQELQQQQSMDQPVMIYNQEEQQLQQEPQLVSSTVVTEDVPQQQQQEQQQLNNNNINNNQYVEEEEYQPTTQQDTLNSTQKRNTVLSPQTQAIEKQFQQGRNAIRYQSVKPPQFVSVFIRELRVPRNGGIEGNNNNASSSSINTLQPDPQTLGGGEYCLAWCRANEREVDATRYIPFGEIAALVVGKQSSVFKKGEMVQTDGSNQLSSQLLSSIDDRSCVSIIPTATSLHRSLHLQFGSAEEVTSFISGLSSLMNEYYQLKPVIYQPSTYFEQEKEYTRDFELEKETSRERDEEIAQATMQDREWLVQNAQGNSNAAGDNKYKIELACRCLDLPTTETQTVSQGGVVHTNNNTSGNNSNILICLVDRNDRTHRLEYVDQTELLPFDQQGRDLTFNKHFSLTTSQTQSKTIRFNVYRVPHGVQSIEDGYRIGSALISLQSLIEQPQAEFVYTLTHKQDGKHQALVQAGSKLAVKCVSVVALNEQGQLAAPVVATNDVQQPSQVVPAGSNILTPAERLAQSEKLLILGDTFISHLPNNMTQHIALIYKHGVPSQRDLQREKESMNATEVSHQVDSTGAVEKRFIPGVLTWNVIDADGNVLEPSERKEQIEQDHLAQQQQQYGRSGSLSNNSSQPTTSEHQVVNPLSRTNSLDPAAHSRGNSIDANNGGWSNQAQTSTGATTTGSAGHSRNSSGTSSFNSRQLSLRSISDIFVGRKPGSNFSQECRDEQCFSLVSKSGQRLDLEAKSKQVRDKWVQGVIQCLKATATAQRERGTSGSTHEQRAERTNSMREKEDLSGTNHDGLKQDSTANSTRLRNSMDKAQDLLGIGVPTTTTAPEHSNQQHHTGGTISNEKHAASINRNIQAQQQQHRI